MACLYPNPQLSLQPLTCSREPRGQGGSSPQMLQVFWRRWRPTLQGQVDGQERTGGLGPCHAPVACGLPHHFKWLGFKAITAGTKVRRLQQLVNAISQAALKGQVPLYNAGLFFTHHELTLKGEGIEVMGIAALNCPAFFLNHTLSLDSQAGQDCRRTR